MTYKCPPYLLRRHVVHQVKWLCLLESCSDAYKVHPPTTEGDAILWRSTTASQSSAPKVRLRMGRRHIARQVKSQQQMRQNLQGLYLCSQRGVATLP